MIRTRRATSSDVPALLPLIEAYWDFEGITGLESGAVAEQLTRLLLDTRLGSCWTAFVDGLAAGYLLAVYVFSLEHCGLTAEIDEFFVLAKQRGRGIGAELLKNAESDFVEVGCTNVSLQLARGNEAARAFYAGHEYTERSGYELLDKMLVAD